MADRSPVLVPVTPPTVVFLPPGKGHDIERPYVKVMASIAVAMLPPIDEYLSAYIMWTPSEDSVVTTVSHPLPPFLHHDKMWIIEGRET